MKLFNTIIVYDCYVLAESEEEARAALLANIKADLEPPSSENAIETREERNVREAWRDKKPMVGDMVSDADFNRAKGKTTIEVFNMLHVRDPKKAGAK